MYLISSDHHTNLAVIYLASSRDKRDVFLKYFTLDVTYIARISRLAKVPGNDGMSRLTTRR